MARVIVRIISSSFSFFASESFPVAKGKDGWPFGAVGLGLLTTFAGASLNGVAPPVMEPRAVELPSGVMLSQRSNGFTEPSGRDFEPRFTFAEKTVPAWGGGPAKKPPV